jgi:hypothetical protein
MVGTRKGKTKNMEGRKGRKKRRKKGGGGAAGGVIPRSVQASSS